MEEDIKTETQTPDEMGEAPKDEAPAEASDQEAVAESQEADSVETEPSTAEMLTPEAIEALQVEVEAYRAKAEDNLEGWQRALADFANYKKRVEREQASVHQNAVGKVILRYLEVSDDLQRALQNRPPDGDGAEWAEGIMLIYRKLQSYLESDGVKPMDALGEPFDPSLHEAIGQEPSDEYESGHIIGVVKTGYYLGDRVLRPALVRVAE